MPECLKINTHDRGSCLPTEPVNRANMYFATHKKILQLLRLLTVTKKISFLGVSFIGSWDPENVPEVAGLLCNKAAFLGNTIKETPCQTVLAYTIKYGSTEFR
jgi:hypothetical protein